MAEVRLKLLTRVTSSDQLRVGQMVRAKGCSLCGGTHEMTLEASGLFTWQGYGYIGWLTKGSCDDTLASDFAPAIARGGLFLVTG